MTVGGKPRSPCLQHHLIDAENYIQYPSIWEAYKEGELTGSLVRCGVGKRWRTSMSIRLPSGLDY